MNQAKCLRNTSQGFALYRRSLQIGVLLALCASALFGLELCVISQGSAGALDGVVAPGTSGAGCPSDPLWASVGPAQFKPASGIESHLRLARLTSGSQRLRIGIDTAGDVDLSEYDGVILFFDADNNNSWTDDKDFALRVRAAQEVIPIADGEQCNNLTQADDIQYYPRTGGAWGANDAAAAAQVSAEYAFDYVTEDVWNLEIEIPINTSGTTFRLDTASAPYFAVGGYVFADDGHDDPQTGQVVAWPEGVESVLIGDLPDIVAFSGDILNLQTLEPNPATLGDINLGGNVEISTGCFDVSIVRESWTINDVVVAPGNEAVNPGLNQFRFSVMFEGPGTEVTPLANVGTVGLRLDPYNSTNPHGQINRPDMAVTIPNFNQEFVIPDNFTLHIPNDLPPEFKTNLNFVCAYPSVDFPIDDDSTNNQEHINHNYIETSEFTQALLISADGIPGLNPGDTATILLNLNTLNENPSLSSVPSLSERAPAPGATGAGGTSLSLASIAMIVVGLALILFALVKRKHSKPAIVWLAFLIGLALLVIGLLQACEKREPTVGTDRWQIENTAELGIQPWRDKPGWFQIPVQVGEPKTLSVRFVGQPLPYETQTMRLEGAVEGQPNKVDIPVEPGQIVTVIARGGVDVDGGDGPLPPNAAGGFTEQLQPVPDAAVADERMRFFGNRPPLSGVFRPGTVAGAATARVLVPIDAAIAANQRYPMPEGHYLPNQWAGALTGWFHGGETQSGVFVVGRRSSIVVPEGVNTLSLFVNAQWTAYPVLTGFYDLSIVRNRGPQVPTRTVSGGDATYQTPPLIRSWLTLTSFNSYSYYIQGNAPTGTLRPLGQAHVSIYASHVGEVAVQ